MKNFQNLYEETLPGCINLRYEGEVSFELVDSILFSVSKRLELIESNINLRKKVYSVLMECCQNLCFHIEIQKSGPAELNHGFISLKNTEGFYQITTGNYIRNEKVQDFKNFIEKIASKSPEELKRLYNEVLTNNHYSSKGGGGLGLIDIAKKSRNQLDYSFTRKDDVNTYFTLNVNLKI